MLEKSSKKFALENFMKSVQFCFEIFEKSLPSKNCLKILKKKCLEKKITSKIASKFSGKNLQKIA